MDIPAGEGETRRGLAHSPELLPKTPITHHPSPSSPFSVSLSSDYPGGKYFWSWLHQMLPASLYFFFCRHRQPCSPSIIRPTRASQSVGNACCFACWRSSYSSFLGGDRVLASCTQFFGVPNSLFGGHSTAFGRLNIAWPQLNLILINIIIWT